MTVARRLALCTLAALLAPASAWACSVAVPGGFALDPEAADTAGPSFDPGEIAVRVTRGTGPDCNCAGDCSFTSCDDLGFIALVFPAATDPDQPEQPDSEYFLEQEGVGYLFSVVDGSMPDGLYVSSDPSAAWYQEGNASTLFVWIDGSEDDQEPFDFDLSIQAIDLAGNLSEAFVVTIADPGSTETTLDCGEDKSGCNALAGAASTGPLALSLLLLGLGRRRAAPTC